MFAPGAKFNDGFLVNGVPACICCKLGCVPALLLQRQLMRGATSPQQQQLSLLQKNTSTCMSEMDVVGVSFPLFIVHDTDKTRVSLLVRTYTVLTQRRGMESAAVTMA